MPGARFLTKSRFKLAADCPTKLFYTGKPAYSNQTIDDSFQMALADGGFQVGELAKCYFPNGTCVETLDYDEALGQSNELLLSENAVVFEAAVKYQNFFIRIDVLVKSGQHLDLIEVKSKSFDPTLDSMANKNGTISSNWKPYLFDVAFQKFVLERAFPDCTVSAFLMVADKSVVCPTDGLNQKFRISSENGRKRAVVCSPITEADLSSPILCKINVDDLCTQLYDTAEGSDSGDQTFNERANYYSDYYSRDEKIITQPNSGCKTCEFRTTLAQDAEGRQNGFRECWSTALGWTQDEFLHPTIMDISNYHHTRKAARFADGRLPPIHRGCRCPAVRK